MSISSLIPLHYKEDRNIYFKVRSIILGILGIALVQSITAFGFLIFKSDLVELGMNLGSAVYALICILSIRYFKSIENYLNAVLSGFYLFVFAFVIIHGGLLSDAIFWLAILLMINILCTKKEHTQFWTIVVFGFMTTIAILSNLGVKFEVPHYDQVYRALNLTAFFSALLIAVFMFSGLKKKSTKTHREEIGRLEKLHEEKKDMIDVITHDLKSPTNRILGLIQILDRTNLRDEQLEIIDLIKKTNESSNNIINSILGPSKFGCNKAEEYDLGLLLKDLQKSYQLSANDKNIALTLHLSDRFTLQGNKFQLIRILDNLLTNAIKYSNVGGEVIIRAFKADKQVKVLITDSGPGFSEADRKLLFDKSAELTARPTGNEASHGLGLYIVKKLSKETGIGVDLIESSAMGSTFEVTLPLLS